MAPPAGPGVWVRFHKRFELIYLGTLFGAHFAAAKGRKEILYQGEVSKASMSYTTSAFCKQTKENLDREAERGGWISINRFDRALIPVGQIAQTDVFKQPKPVVLSRFNTSK